MRYQPNKKERAEQKGVHGPSLSGHGHAKWKETHERNFKAMEHGGNDGVQESLSVGAQESDLSTHLEKPYVCDFEGCLYAFSHSSSLANHRRRHNGEGTLEKPCVCNFEGCLYSSSRASNLARHKRSHTGEKPYVCDFEGCAVAYSESGNLTTHKRKHSGEKPYVCDFEGCSYALPRADSLARHKRRHSGEKPYVCNFEGCAYASCASSNLAIHMRGHTGEKPYVCDFEDCLYSSSRANNLARHKRCMHSKEGILRKKRYEEQVAKFLMASGISFERESRVAFTCFATVFSLVSRKVTAF